MSYALFKNVLLAAVSAVVPANSVHIEDELEYYGGDVEKARKLTERGGLSTRRVAPEGVTASDLCIQAAENLFLEHGVNRDEIDALIFVSHSPDYLLPASAAVQQAALGLSSGCAVMDMNVGCAGFVQGLWVAGGLVESGACPKVLLLVGDTPNRFQDSANRVTAPVFGDAGTAALLERGSGAGMSFLLGSDGKRHEALVIPGGGGRIPPDASETGESAYNQVVTDSKGNPWSLGGYCKIWMDPMAIFAFSVSVVPPHLRRHLELAELGVDALDALLLHQANKIIIESIGKKLGLEPAKVPFETLPMYGNLGSSSIPALICEHYSPGGQGADEARGKVMLCGFGAGLAWASCLLSLEDTKILPVKEYRMAEKPQGREERIAYWHGKFSKA